ncbi:MAG: hypothetical protein ACD_4C00188G0001, partial [uncultured bacterium (gcode 4)]
MRAMVQSIERIAITTKSSTSV